MKGVGRKSNPKARKEQSFDQPIPKGKLSRKTRKKKETKSKSYLSKTINQSRRLSTDTQFIKPRKLNANSSIIEEPENESNLGFSAISETAKRKMTV